MHWLASSVLDINKHQNFLDSIPEGLRLTWELHAYCYMFNSKPRSQLSLDYLCSGVVRERERKGENGECFTKEHWFPSPPCIPRTCWTLSAHPSFFSTPSVWWFRESQAHLLGRTLSEFHFLLLRSKRLTRAISRKKGFIPLTIPGSSALERGSQCRTHRQEERQQYSHLPGLSLSPFSPFTVQDTNSGHGTTCSQAGPFDIYQYNQEHHPAADMSQTQQTQVNLF